MPSLEGSVGHTGGANSVHDVALVQVMLRLIKNPKGLPYATFQYDGTCGLNGGTHKAIKEFQADQKIPMGLGQETDGLVTPLGATFRKMCELLPMTHKDLMSLKGTRPLVYLAGPAHAATASAASIRADKQFQAGFASSLASLVDTMYSTHKMVLVLVPDTGGVRTFQGQADIETNNPSATEAGPGESNHNWGNGADLGFDLTFVSRRTGELKANMAAPKHHLVELQQESDALFVELWDIRNKLAPTLHKSNKQYDYIHIQSYSDDNVSMSKSLASLLTAVGNMSWEAVPGKPNEYKSNYGLGDEIFDIGKQKSSAYSIWLKKCDVSETNLAKALNQAVARRKKLGDKLADKEEQIYQDLISLHTTVPEKFDASNITGAHCDKMRTWLKKDFETAEASKDKWTAVAK